MRTNCGFSKPLPFEWESYMRNKQTNRQTRSKKHNVAYMMTG